MSFAGAERKFFEKGIRIDRKPVPVCEHLCTQTDVNLYSKHRIKT